MRQQQKQGFFLNISRILLHMCNTRIAIWIQVVAGSKYVY